MKPEQIAELELPNSVLAFDSFLNEPPAYEDRKVVRDYRYEAYVKWRLVVSDIRDIIATAKDVDRLKAERDELAMVAVEASRFIGHFCGWDNATTDREVTEDLHKRLLEAILADP
jgi:hypothetical protein